MHSGECLHTLELPRASQLHNTALRSAASCTAPECSMRFEDFGAAAKQQRHDMYTEGTQSLHASFAHLSFHPQQHQTYKRHSHQQQQHQQQQQHEQQQLEEGADEIESAEQQQQEKQIQYIYSLTDMIGAFARMVRISGFSV